jgi:hypothetical protein
MPSKYWQVRSVVILTVHIDRNALKLTVPLDYSEIHCASNERGIRVHKVLSEHVIVPQDVEPKCVAEVCIVPYEAAKLDVEMYTQRPSLASVQLWHCMHW